MIWFEVPGRPVPKKRARTVSGAEGVRSYTPAETVEYERRIGWAFREAYRGEPLEGPIGLAIVVYEDPRRPQQRGDLDNYVKTVSDALNGIAWADDVQIESLAGTVRRGCDPPRVLIEVRYADEAPREWVYEL